LKGGKKKDKKMNVLIAMGKHMITLDDLKKVFGQEWEPALVELNPLEIKARERWMNATQPTEHKATYESAEQFQHIIHDTPTDAAKITTS